MMGGALRGVMLDPANPHALSKRHENMVEASWSGRAEKLEVVNAGGRESQTAKDSNAGKEQRQRRRQRGKAHQRAHNGYGGRSASHHNIIKPKTEPIHVGSLYGPCRFPLERFRCGRKRGSA